VSICSTREGTKRLILAAVNCGGVEIFERRGYHENTNVHPRYKGRWDSNGVTCIVVVKNMEKIVIWKRNSYGSSASP